MQNLLIYFKNFLKADMMFQNQNCEVIVMGYHINDVKNTLWVYSPETSAGKEFLGSENGKLVTKIFKTFIETRLSK